MTENARADVVVDIVASCHNGEAYIAEFLESVRRQSHASWRLWVRDDGSSDATMSIVDAVAARDARIHVLHRGAPALGVTGAFGWLLERVPPDARYIMFADQDDVWLTHKIERTLGVMHDEERRNGGAVLVHSDLTVVDERLAVLDRSFWEFSGIDPEPVSLSRLLVQNVVTGAAAMINADLHRRAGRMPANAVYHDWWYACVAAAFGRVVALRESTILYRQHGRNVVGAVARRRPWFARPGAVWRALHSTSHFRAELARTSRQAAALVERFGSELPDEERRLVAAYASLPGRPFLRRKLEVARLRLRREHGFWRNVGALLRA
ncbi:MAG: glycosyltransferase family 2 protein [Gemmatimonadaceae bacterium]